MIRFVAAAGLAAFSALAAEAPVWSDRVAVAVSAEKTIARWPDLARAAARETMERYGKPDELGPDALVWYANGPWKKTMVHRLAWPHYTFARDKDYLENTIVYAVLDGKLEELARFDRKLDVDQVSGELSSRSESEAVNYLTLNLAHEVNNGKRTVDEAREFQTKTLRLAAAGKASPYLRRLLFETGDVASPDNHWNHR